MTVTPRAAGDILTAAMFNTKLEAPILANELWVPPLCVVRHSVDQTLSNGVDQTLNFDTDVHDPTGMHDPATNNPRITIALPGLYLITWLVSFASNTASFRAVTCYKNAGAFVDRSIGPPANGERTEFGISFYERLAAGDYVYLAGYQNSGGSIVAGTITQKLPHFAVEWRAA